MKLKQKITHNLLNIPGWRTKRHIVVIESDDWGSIRMPSRKVYEEFLRKGIAVDKDPYCRYDSLATADDLSALFDVLTSVKDRNGHHAVLTANTVVANPIFDKIRDSGFREYYYEPFTETLTKSPIHNGALELWKQGMGIEIFYPQFHGREHLNVKKWLRTLMSGEEITRISFNLGTFGLTSAVDTRIKNNYMGAFNSGLKKDIEEYRKILTEGLNLFENLFGFRSKSFIATTYTWPCAIEPTLYENGIKYLQGLVSQREPIDDDTTFTFRNRNFQGKKNKNGLTYLMRNCFFEPSHFRDYNDVVGDCLKRIGYAFRWNKAAVISTHRLNYIGSIDENNRKQNLKLLHELLSSIIKRWPDVEFVNSVQLGDIIRNSIK